MESEQNELYQQNNPLGYFVLSTDTLRGIRPDEILTKDWTNKPPLFQHHGKKSGTERTLKRTCRLGVPPALRSAIWLTNVLRKARPYQTMEETYEYGTLKKVEILDHGWDVAKKNVFSDQSDEEAATIPDFGVDPKKTEALLIQDHCFHDEGLSIKGVNGVKALTKVLFAARLQLGIEYCPLLPDLAGLFLSVMPESYAYSIIREMSNNSEYYFPMTKVQHLAWCKTFADLMTKMYPQAASRMKGCGALSIDGLSPIFQRFFISILKREHVLRLVDIYTIEGCKVIFRMGTVITCLCIAFMATTDFRNNDTFWSAVKRITHSHNFNFEVLLRQAYGFNGRRYKRRRSFPRRKFIERITEYNEEWAESYSSSHSFALSIRPLGFVEGDIPIVLAKQATTRMTLTEYLPFAYKSTKIELMYSSNVHGRCLKTFYKHCAKAKHTITLMEVLQTGGTIGMFATDTWHASRKVYGDGECILFRLSPDPVCYSWTHQTTHQPIPSDCSYDGSTVGSVLSNDAESFINNEEALLSEFMVSKDNFIAMGSNSDGTCGLRLNEDLSKGTSAKARGFNNEPLAGDEYPEFDIGLVEVYQLIREIDGKAIDGDEGIWKDMFD